MKPEDKVVSLDLAKRMKKLGWEDNTERYWICNEYDSWQLNDVIGIYKRYYPAPDAIEIGERLPEEIEIEKCICYLQCNKYYTGIWGLIYVGSKKESKYCNGNTEAEARGKMWCYLKERG